MKKFRKALIAVLSIVAVIAATMGLVACKKEKKYQLTFANAEIAAVSVEDGKTFTLPTKPTKDGFEFEGWYLDASFGGDSVTEVKVTSDTTVYAKWTQLYTISLELSGGNLSKTSLTVKKGENVYNAVKNLNPTKTGYEFIGWYNGNSSLGTGVKADKNLTLTAKYGVGYDVEIWTQNTTLDGYELAETRHFVKDLGNKESVTISANETVEGFTATENDNEVLSATLKAGEAKVVLKQYFDRNEYDVIYNSNYKRYSSDTENTEVTEKGYYGIEKSVQTELFSFDGYYLEGWAESANGEIKYRTYYLDNHKFGEAATKTPDNIDVSESTVLYAVWSKGYTDIASISKDVYYISKNSAGEEEIYLFRGRFFIKGRYISKSGRFFVDDLVDGEKIIKQGKLNDNGTYTYSDSTVSADAEYYQYTGNGINANAKITLKETDATATYEIKDSQGKVTDTSTGTYTREETKYYVLYTATFDSGDKAGTTLHFIVGTAGSYKVFQECNESHKETGKLYLGSVEKGSHNVKIEDNYIRLDGFGIATVYNAQDEEQGAYNYAYSKTTAGELVQLTVSNSRYVYKVSEQNGKKVLLSYSSSAVYNKTYTFTNGDTLTLDGFGFATYVKGGETIEGTYGIENANDPFGALLNVFSGENTYRILIKTTTEIQLNDKGVQTKVTVYTPELKSNEYKALYYKTSVEDADGNTSYGIYKVPMVIGEEEGKARIYSLASNGNYVNTLVADWTYNGETGLYTLTNITEVAYEWNGLTDITKDFIDKIKSYKTIIFYGDTSTYQVAVWYIRSYAGEDEVLKPNYTEYTGANNTKITLLLDIALYSDGENVYTGTYSKKSNASYYTVSYLKDGETVKIYVEFNEENKTFTVLESLPYTLTLTTDSKVTLVFDGKGGVTYTVTQDRNNKTEIAGSVTETSEKALISGSSVYEFTPADEANAAYKCKFIMLYKGSSRYFAKFDEKFSGTFTSGAETLVLDGYIFRARYTDADGNSTTDSSTSYAITITEDTAIVSVAVNNATRYFDIDATTKTFTIKGVEYGTYYVYENGNQRDYYVELNGYSHAKLFKLTYDKDGNAVRNYINENATYILEGDNVIISDANGDILLAAERGYMIKTISGQQYKISILIVTNDEKFATAFVNKSDLNVLVLDRMGNAVRYDKDGKRTTGSYVIVTGTTDAEGNTKGLLYFTDGSKYATYNYDVKEKTITENDSYEEVAYYSEDFSLLYFTNYGLCQVDVERCYYEVVNGKYVVYKYDPDSSDASEFGFVEVDLGTMGDTKTYGDKLYYRHGTSAINFERSGDSGEFKLTGYPVEKITVAPGGEDEFKANGYVQVKTSEDKTANLNGVVRRVKTETGYETYLDVTTTVGGVFTFKINLSYRGRDNATFTVEALSYEVNAAPSIYYSIAQFYYMFTGTIPANTYGTVNMKQEYNSANEVTSVSLKVNYSEVYSKTLGFVDAAGATLSVDVNDINAVKVAGYLNNSQTVYRTDFEGNDGYKYSLYYIFSLNSTFNAASVQIYALTRNEENTDNGLTVVTQRIVTTDTLTAGDYFSVIVKKGDAEYSLSLVKELENGNLRYGNRKVSDDKKSIETHYFDINFVERTPVEGVKVLPLEKVIAKEIENVYTYRNSRGDIVMDVVLDKDSAVLYYYNGMNMDVASSSYDADKKEVTATTYLNGQEITWVLKIKDRGMAILERWVGKVTDGTPGYSYVLADGSHSIFEYSTGVYVVTDGETAYRVDGKTLEVTGLTLVKGDNGAFVVISEDGANVLFFTTDGNTVYKPSATVKNSEGNYTVSYDTTVNGNKVTKTYTVIITEGKVTITEVTEAE